MALTAKQRQFLKSHAHHYRPVVTAGARGITDAVLQEVDAALTAHELVKVRVAGDRDDRASQADQLRDGCGAEWVATVGRMVILYRPHPDQPRIQLP